MKRWIKQRSWLAAGVALGAAALIAGCGGTSSSSSGRQRWRRRRFLGADRGIEPAERDHPELQPVHPIVRGDVARGHVADVRAAAPDQRDQARSVLQLARHRIQLVERRKVDHVHDPSWGEVVQRHADDRGRRRLHLQHDQAVPRRQQHGAGRRKRELDRQSGDAQLLLAAVRQPAEHRRPDVHRSGIDLEQGRRSRASTPTRTRSVPARTPSPSSARRGSR